jgi:hypothetical protein
LVLREKQVKKTAKTSKKRGDKRNRKKTNHKKEAEDWGWGEQGTGRGKLCQSLESTI